jgi:hypothetical protein
MVVGASAAIDFTDVKDIDPDRQEAIDMSVALNIIEGFPDKSFQPKGNVTRAQISKMICIAINGGEVPATAVKAAPSFTDIKGHWAEGFIEYCTAKGIIAGYPDGTFKPEQNVTGAEAAKMMLVALGYNADVENYVGDDWDLYVNVQANQDGLFVDLLGVEDLTTKELSRENTAQMIWNMLRAYTIKQTNSIDRTSGEVTQSYAKSDNTLFWESYRGRFLSGEVKGFKHEKDGDWTYYVTPDNYQQKVDLQQNGVPATMIKVEVSDAHPEWIGHKVNVAINGDARNAAFKADDGTCYGLFHDEGDNLGFTYENPVYFGDLEELGRNDDTLTLNGKSYRMDAGNGTVSDLPVYVRVNGSDNYVSLGGLVDSGKTDNEGKAIFRTRTLWDVAGKNAAGNNIYRYDHLSFIPVDKDENGKIDFLMTAYYTVGQVTNVNASGSKVSINVYGNNTPQFLEDVNAYDNLQKNDWVVYTPGQYTLDKDVDSIVKAETMSGEITRANDRTIKASNADSALATIGGVQYAFVDPAFFDITMGEINDLCKVGNTLTDAVIVHNYIFAVDKVKKAAITDYALVTAVGPADGKDGDWAKLLFYNSKSAQTVDTAYDYSDPASSNYIAPGTLVVYSRNSNGDYILNKAPSVGFNGYKVEGRVIGGDAISNNKTTVGYLEGTDTVGKATINDDAVIFARWQTATDQVKGTYSYKVMTGAQLKLNDWWEIGDSTSLTDNDPGTYDITSLILGSKIKGNSYVELAYVDIVPGLEDTPTLYAYVENSSTLSNDRLGVKVHAVDLFTAEGQHQADVLFAGAIETAGVAERNIDAGKVIAYKMNEYNEISEILGVFDADDAAGTVTVPVWDNVSKKFVDSLKAYVQTVAITDDSPFTVRYFDYDNLNNRVYHSTDGNGYKQFDFTDAKYIMVDNTKRVGVGTLDTYVGQTAYQDNGSYVNNALVVYNANGNVLLVIVDSDNNINFGRDAMSTGA